MSDTPTLPHEVHYAASTLKWRFLPVNEEKEALISAWTSTASNDIQQLARWAKQFPSCGWALLTGEHLFVLDEDGKLGRDTVETWKQQGQALPPTLTVTTGRAEGGKHHYFTMPAGITIRNRTALAPGIDIKGTNGYVVFAGSIHKTRTRYTIFDALPLAPAPQWLLEKLAKPETETPAPQPSQPTHDEPTDRERAYAQQALRNEVATLSCVQRGRNTALNTAALHIGEMVGAGWITRDSVTSALWEAAATNGYRAKDGHNTAWNTLQSGLVTGMNKPRAPLPVDEVAEHLREVLSQNKFPIQNIALPPPQPKHIEVTTMSSITPEKVEWLWEPWLALKKVALFAGTSGVGKSTLTLALAAIASKGGDWPDGTPCTHSGHVLVWTSEDGVADTVVPRLIAAGANPNRVHIITGTSDGKGGTVPFSPSHDIPLLKAQVAVNSGIVLIIVDPIISVVDADMNQANVVRCGLQPVVDFADEVGCCVLGITHFKKNSEGQDPLERVIGSKAFHALPRTIIVAGKDKSSDRRVIAIAKGNIGKDSGGYEYSIQGTVIESQSGPINTSVLRWGNAIEGSAREILDSVEETHRRDNAGALGKLDEAKHFIKLQLANGTTLSAFDIAVAAKQLGISAITLRRAATDVGVIAFKQGFQGKYMWRLPLDFTQDSD